MRPVVLKNIFNYACHGISLEILPGELLVVLGPNGAGKSTLLNVIAGLCEYEGSVYIDGVNVNKLPPQKREVGYLMQDPLLFPHMKVEANIAYGMKSQGWRAPDIGGRVLEVADLLRIKHLLDRYPRQLSGGEKQRVALARCLAPLPKILLLDEPLSALDRLTSRHLRSELKRIQRELGITTIYVTHRLSEAEHLADSIAIIINGKVAQKGSYEDLIFSASQEKVAAFIGDPNVLDCDEVREVGYGLIEASCGGIKFLVPSKRQRIRKIAFFASDVAVSTDTNSLPDINKYRGRILDLKNNGEAIMANIAISNCEIKANIDPETYYNLALKSGQEVYLSVELKNIKFQ